MRTATRAGQLRRAVHALAGGALGAVAMRQVLARVEPGGESLWNRTNHAGRTVTLLEGPAWALGAAAGLTSGGLAPRSLAPTAHLATGPRGATPESSRLAAAAMGVLGAAALGALDDHVGTTEIKGLKGHLAALRRGRVTTGSLKIVGLAGLGLAVAGTIDASRGTDTCHRWVGTVLGGALVAGGANLVNLCDLRPGRALKVVVLLSPITALPGDTSTVCSAAAAGASLALLPEDLAGRSMLGDTGANAAGALLGTAVVAGTGPLSRAVALSLVAGLVLASERVSFTRVIAETPWLDRIDRWGRAT